MLAIAGDSAAGKTTLTKGLVEALGAERITAICVDDYHRYDRVERKTVPFTPLHPDCNYLEIMVQHLQLLADGKPILKPVYDHSTGLLGRPVVVEPREFVICEGLLPLYSRRARKCFDATVYLDPPEPVRFAWKVRRDTTKRGYEPAQVRADLARREVESAAFIRPQRADADIVVRFEPIEARGEIPEALLAAFHRSPARAHSAADLDSARETAVRRFDAAWAAMERWQDETPTTLSAMVHLRPTIPHPSLANILTEDHRIAMHVSLARDEHDKPIDALHIHAHAPRGVTAEVEEAIWEQLGVDEPLPDSLGSIDGGERSEPLAIVQLLVLYHLLQARKSG
jgi:phosphoribulokinase